MTVQVDFTRIISRPELNVLMRAGLLGLPDGGLRARIADFNFVRARFASGANMAGQADLMARIRAKANASYYARGNTERGNTPSSSRGQCQGVGITDMGLIRTSRIQRKRPMPVIMRDIKPRYWPTSGGCIRSSPPSKKPSEMPRPVPPGPSAPGRP